MYILYILSYPILWISLKIGDRIMKFSLLAMKLCHYTALRASKSNHKIYKLASYHLDARIFRYPAVKSMISQGIDVPASFSAALNLRSAYDKDKILPEWKICNKTSGPEFARLLGLQLPKQLSINLSFEEITPVENTVIKPLFGYYSRGVFIVKSKNEILELNTGKVFYKWEELTNYAHSLMSKKVVRSNIWKVEQYISDENGNPVTDIKFNLFYGTVGWIAEIKRHPEVRYNIMDGVGQTFNSELYAKKQLFPGMGTNENELDLLKKISLEIPVPFIRIDLMRGAGGLFFSEFTAYPGIIGLFDRKREHQYGKLYHEAETRLYNDLIAGKKFETFKQFTANA